MDRVPSSIDEGLQQMQTEARARGLLHLTRIFGSLYTREQLLSALEAYSLNAEEASIFLQDNLTFKEKTKKPECVQNEELVEFDKETIDNSQNTTAIETVEGPKEGKIALEFSLSHAYINSEVPVFYIIDEILKEIFSFLSAGERAKLASVCRTFKMIDEKTGYLYKQDCIICWPRPARPTNIFFSPYDDTAEL